MLPSTPSSSFARDVKALEKAAKHPLALAVTQLPVEKTLFVVSPRHEKELVTPLVLPSASIQYRRVLSFDRRNEDDTEAGVFNDDESTSEDEDEGQHTPSGAFPLALLLGLSTNPMTPKGKTRVTSAPAQTVGVAATSAELQDRLRKRLLGIKPTGIAPLRPSSAARFRPSSAAAVTRFRPSSASSASSSASAAVPLRAAPGLRTGSALSKRTERGKVLIDWQLAMPPQALKDESTRVAKEERACADAILEGTAVPLPLPLPLPRLPSASLMRRETSAPQSPLPVPSTAGAAQGGSPPKGIKGSQAAFSRSSLSPTRPSASSPATDSKQEARKPRKGKKAKAAGRKMERITAVTPVPSLSPVPVVSPAVAAAPPSAATPSNLTQSASSSSLHFNAGAFLAVDEAEGEGRAGHFATAGIAGQGVAVPFQSWEDEEEEEKEHGDTAEALLREREAAAITVSLAAPQQRSPTTRILPSSSAPAAAGLGGWALTANAAAAATVAASAAAPGALEAERHFAGLEEEEEEREERAGNADGSRTVEEDEEVEERNHEHDMATATAHQESISAWHRPPLAPQQTPKQLTPGGHPTARPLSAPSVAPSPSSRRFASFDSPAPSLQPASRMSLRDLLLIGRRSYGATSMPLTATDAASSSSSSALQLVPSRKELVLPFGLGAEAERESRKRALAFQARARRRPQTAAATTRRVSTTVAAALVATPPQARQRGQGQQVDGLAPSTKALPLPPQKAQQRPWRPASAPSAVAAAPIDTGHVNLRPTSTFPHPPLYQPPMRKQKAARRHGGELVTRAAAAAAAASRVPRAAASPVVVVTPASLLSASPSPPGGSRPFGSLSIRFLRPASAIPAFSSPSAASPSAANAGLFGPSSSTTGNVTVSFGGRRGVRIVRSPYLSLPYPQQPPAPLSPSSLQLQLQLQQRHQQQAFQHPAGH